MNEVCTFSTIEDFWRYHNHIPKPSEIFFDGETRKKVGPNSKSIVEFNLFKKGIQPEWSDPQNACGGSFYIRQTLDMTTLDLKLLKDKKIVKKKYIKLKILGDGDIKNKINLTVNFASKQAQIKIEKVGGTLNILKKYQAQAKPKKDGETLDILKK